MLGKATNAIQLKRNNYFLKKIIEVKKHRDTKIKVIKSDIHFKKWRRELSKWQNATWSFLVERGNVSYENSLIYSLKLKVISVPVKGKDPAVCTKISG